MNENDQHAARAGKSIKVLMGLANSYQPTPEAAVEFAALQAQVIALHHSMREFGRAHHHEVTANFGDT